MRRPYEPPADDVVEVEGAEYLGVRCCDRGFAALLGLPLGTRSPWEGNGFLEYILKLRNKAVETKLKEIFRMQDPDADADAVKNRRSFVDEVSKVLTIHIDNTEDYDGYDMNVLSSTNAGDILWLEITPENLAFLAKAVHYAPPSTKTKKARTSMCNDAYPAVKKRRMGRVNVVYITYLDVDGKQHTKTRTVCTSGDQALVDAHEESLAKELQAEYERLSNAYTYAAMKTYEADQNNASNAGSSTDGKNASNADSSTDGNNASNADSSTGGNDATPSTIGGD